MQTVREIPLATVKTLKTGRRSLLKLSQRSEFVCQKQLTEFLRTFNNWRADCRYIFISVTVWTFSRGISFFCSPPLRLVEHFTLRVTKYDWSTCPRKTNKSRRKREKRKQKTISKNVFFFLYIYSAIIAKGQFYSIIETDSGNEKYNAYNWMLQKYRQFKNVGHIPKNTPCCKFPKFLWEKLPLTFLWKKIATRWPMFRPLWQLAALICNFTLKQNGRSATENFRQSRCSLCPRED